MAHRGRALGSRDLMLAGSDCRQVGRRRAWPHQVVGEEARALGSLKEELPDCSALVPSQLLHQLRQEEGHLQAQPFSGSRTFWQCEPK